MKSRKTDNLTVRFEPRLRYLASLGARSQHRSLSAFVEWAVQEQLKTLEIHGKSLLDLSLWDVDEAARLKLLAINAPNLLTFDEEVWAKQQGLK